MKRDIPWFDIIMMVYFTLFFGGILSAVIVHLLKFITYSDTPEAGFVIDIRNFK